MARLVAWLATRVGILVAMETPEFMAIIRGMIQHEDTLRDQRLSWLFAMNGFLFAGLGFAWSDDDAGPLVFVLAMVGVLMALSSAAVLNRSQRAIDKLARIAADRAADEDDDQELPPVIAIRSSELQQDGAMNRLGASQLVPWKLLPWALAVVWVLVPVLRALTM